MAIAEDEYLRRQADVRAAARERGLDAVLAFSRGGGTQDRIGDALWLAGVATPQPFVPDLAGHWRAAGHVAVIVPVDGPSVAVVESEESRAAPVADAVIVSADVIAGMTEALGNAQRVGVMSSDAVPARYWSDRFEAADDLGFALRRIKSPAEQDLLRAAGRLGSAAMSAALREAVPGATEADVAAAVFAHVVRAGGAIYDVAVSSGERSGTLAPSGPTAAAWTTRELRAGDLLRIDAYGSLDGYLFDFARSIVVGGGESELIDALREAVLAGIELLHPGTPFADVVRRCEEVLAASAHEVPPNPMGGFWGHGVGVGWEPPWIGPDNDEPVEAGMCLALERRAAVPGLGGAQYEDTVLVGPGGPEVLTAF